jgi:hypothetical protein
MLMSLKRAAALAAAVVVASVATIVPAASFPGGIEDPVGDDGQNLVGNIAEQYNQVNNGEPGGGRSKPPSCEWIDTSEDPSETRDDGEVRWREPGQGHDYWDDSVDGEGGAIFRFECWHDDMIGENGECRVEAPSTTGCLGQAIQETFCGSFLCRFDAITPSNLAVLAVDGFVESLPAPQPRFNPPGGTTYVNFETWMWIESVPAGGSITAPVMQVPGMTVRTTASIDSVRWEMGDGGVVSCPLTVNEATAEADCNYSYVRSSAHQPNATYTGRASTVWLAQWEIDEAPISGQVEAPRTTEFDLQVAEVQTIVTR